MKTNTSLLVALKLWILIGVALGSCSQATPSIARPPGPPQQYFSQEEGTQSSRGRLYCVHLNYEAIYVRFKNRSIRVPIFRGTRGEESAATLAPLIEKWPKKGNSTEPADGLLPNLCYFSDKDSLRTTFFELIGFYHGSLFASIDVNRPTFAVNEHGMYLIAYDFEFQGIPSSMSLLVPATQDAPWVCDIRKARFSPTGEIQMSILIGSRSHIFGTKDACP